jgi:DNA-cytosine methyltransferase
MTKLFSLLCSSVAAGSRDPKVAISLSAGIDSLSTLFALRELGKEVQAYTYELQGYRSQEREKVEAIAQALGVPLRVVTVPTNNLVPDFLRLAIRHRCKKKVQFEVLFKFLYVVPVFDEREIWFGFNADDHYGNTKEAKFEQARLRRQELSLAGRKKAFDRYRQEIYAESDRPDSSHTWRFVSELAAAGGKRLLDPYLDPTIREYFSAFDHDQLSSPGKLVVREALAPQLADLPANSIAKGVKLQIGGGVDKLFRTLLANPDINRFETKYRTVAALCQRWGREVEASPGAFAAELDALPAPPRATIRISGIKGYRPYLTADVMKASETERFTVISTFAGGGGSSVGYRFAGGKVLLASEFVPEAARTYQTNFPDCPVDQRDIREISGTDKTVVDFLGRAGLTPGDLDVLDGSPPCCEFSTAGRGIGDQDILRAYSDVRQSNIASLVFDLIDLVIRAQPKVFICENVPAFASRGAEVFTRALRALRFPADQSGRAYYAHWAVLSANDYGVPQKRKRLFIIGVRRDVAEAVGINSDEAVRSVFPAPTAMGATVRSALANLDQTEQDVWPWTRSAMVGSLGQLVRLLPKNPDKPTRLGHVFPGYKKHYTLTRCAWDKAAPTMVVSGQRPDGLTGAFHPALDRKFTLPELKRLTALPDDFVLTGTLSQAAERVCRMVPPLLTKAIAESVYEKILLPYKENGK